jgi:hypothetical protein
MSNINIIFHFINYELRNNINEKMRNEKIKNEKINIDDYDKSIIINNFYLNIYKKLYNLDDKYNKIFNINNIKKYIELNKEIIFNKNNNFLLDEYNLSPIQIIKEYIKNIEENEKKNIFIYLPIDFNIKIYRSIYKDLEKLDDNQLKNHYLNYGIKEKRIYKLPEDFDPSIYKAIYNDLVNLDDNKLKSHYLNYGIKEKRIYKLPKLLKSL